MKLSKKLGILTLALSLFAIGFSVQAKTAEETPKLSFCGIFPSVCEVVIRGGNGDGMKPPPPPPPTRGG